MNGKHIISAQVTPLLAERIAAKARELDTTVSMLVRQVMEITFLTPDELKERVRRENALRDWFRNGADPHKDPEAEWNPDHPHYKGKDKSNA